MDTHEYQAHYELEERYWWFRARRKAAFRILRRALPRDGSLRILDAGCGTGINLAELGRFGQAFGFDFAAEALAFCRKRNLEGLARADANRLPYRNAAFDLVTYFDVLYHEAVTDDAAALREAARVLKPGGFVLITDSAFEFLRGPHDAAMHGARRYDKKTLRGKLEAAGFEAVRLSYFFMTTFPLIYLKRRLEKRRATRNPGAMPQSDLQPIPPWLNGVLIGALSGEAAWAGRRNVPIGSSIIALACKK
jgi:SAM-dependent methyltransferase